MVASGTDSLSDQGELHDERGAAAGRAVDANLAGVLLNDSVGHRESQSGAAAVTGLRLVLGGEERIVDAMNVFLRDAGAGVGDPSPARDGRCTVLMVSVPPPGMASFALRNRFRNTCCSLPVLP